jgi:hypothetical protein
MNEDVRVLRVFVDNLRIFLGKDPLYDDHTEATDEKRFAGFGGLGREGSGRYLDASVDGMKGRAM